MIPENLNPLLEQERCSAAFKANPGNFIDGPLFLKLAAEAQYVAVDTEGTGLEVHESGPDYCIGISMAYRLMDTGVITSKYFPIDHSRGNISQEEEDLLFDWFDDRRDPLIFHNMKYDYLAFTKLGVKLTGPCYDTMNMAHMVDEYNKFMSLDRCVKFYLGRDGKHKSELWQLFYNAMGFCAEFPPEVMAGYAVGDTVETLLLFEELLQLLIGMGIIKK